MAKRPEGAPIAVLRPPLLKPMAVIAHEIAEAADCGIPRMLDEARIAQGQRVVFRERPGVETVQQHQRARIVVDAITVGAIGHDADAMLQDSEIIAHRADRSQRWRCEHFVDRRSEESSVGTECVSTGRSWWSTEL